MPPVHTIQLSTCAIDIDEAADIDDVRRAVPNFFTGNRRRESFTMHRGAVISRCTVQFTGRQPERHTSVYLFTRNMEGGADTMCVSGGQHLASVRQAKRLVDHIITTGRYEFGMSF
jgi:hypothetical protein